MLDNQQKKFSRDLSKYLSRKELSSFKRERSVDAFKHAWMLVNTRSFYWDYPGSDEPHDDALTLHSRRSKRSGKKWSSSDDCMTLCPFIDFFNHAAEATNVSRIASGRL